MTKIKCRKCEKSVSIASEYIRNDNSIAMCKVCTWIKNHNGIPEITGFTEEEIIKTLHFLFYEDSLLYNDLSNLIGRTIQDTVKLIQNLKVGARRQIRIKVPCEKCGKAT